MYIIFPRTRQRWPISSLSSVSDLNSIASQIWLKGPGVCVYACMCVCVCLVVVGVVKSWSNVHLPLRADVSVVIFSGAHQAIIEPEMYFA